MIKRRAERTATYLNVDAIEMSKFNAIRNTFCKKMQLVDKGISAYNQKQIVDKGVWTDRERDIVIEFWDNLVNPEGHE
jgi:hypothetical protein